MSYGVYDPTDPFDHTYDHYDETLNKIEHKYLDLCRKNAYYDEQISCLEHSICCLVILLIIILSFIFYVLSHLVSSVTNVQEVLNF